MGLSWGRLFRRRAAEKPDIAGRRIIDMTRKHRSWGHSIEFFGPGVACGWGPPFYLGGTPRLGDVILHEFVSTKTATEYVAALLVLDRDWGAMQGMEDGWSVTYRNLGPYDGLVR